ncbi:MAG: hypothetical protein DRI23_10875 [Candidatus Cloacimonadota bacterium]|nr:MAG: hypothetical protein DRI23_10875 [Candidatus Cloacimonadota bacterium]RLC51676.1 MAG: hypothetical protein DRH79_05845 [Candidatus Cloacimonadota bacterium]
MSDKILNLKLKYKDKYLDTARYKRDFDGKFFIGSDKMQFWQILDDKFPAKYNLISKVGDKFKMTLRQGMDVVVKKGDRVLTKEELQQSKLLNKNILTLDPGSVGRLRFGGKWEIEYSFTKPYVYVASPEEIALAKQFAKFAPISPQEKFTRIFIILGILFTAVGLYIAESNYVPPVEIDFTERLQKIEEMATEIEVPQVEVEQEEVVERATTKAVEEEAVTEQVEEAQAMTEAEFEQEFGLALDSGMPGGEGSGDFANELLEVTEVSEIVAAGTGSGDGGPQASRGAADLDVASSSGFDAGSATGLGDIAGLEGMDLGGTGGFEEVDVAGLGGDLGSYSITKVESKAQFAAVKKRFAGIKMVKEGSVKLEEMTPEAKTELANIDQIVSTYKPQITKLFTTESMMMDMYGTIEFSLIISASGKVEAVDIEVADGSYFTDSFIGKCRQIILNWKIRVKEPIGYAFRMKFYK